MVTSAARAGINFEPAVLPIATRFPLTDGEGATERRRAISHPALFVPDDPNEPKATGKIV